jgi:hypothetical protein
MSEPNLGQSPAPLAGNPPPALPAAPGQPPVTTTAPAAPPVQMPAEPAAAPASAAPAELPPEWPTRGYTGPQPWEVQNPPALIHDRGILIVGSAGEEVLELAACLARLGYQTSITRGENVNMVYDQDVAAQVTAFHRDYGVAEDPAIISASTANAVGPWTWEALFRLVSRAETAA